jgi:disulfide bond formation protein DsbB
MLEKLQNIAHGRGYWLTLAVVGFAFIAVALYYQYVLETLPCVLCIQVRLWIMCMILVAVFALAVKHTWARRASHVLIVLIAAGLIERSYLLLGTERGFVFRDCGFDLGLPSWLALDAWLPALFRVEASCGYTPELFAGITMAQALMVFSSLLLITSLALTLAPLTRRSH